MKKNFKIILYFFTAIILTIIFFSYSVTITVDSAHYIWLSTIIFNNDFVTWDIIRGFVFPIYIKCSNALFGNTVMGLKVGMYIMYCIMILTAIFIYKDSIKKDKIASKKFKIITYIVFIFLVVLNPIIFGYYHSLLTEFWAITISIVFCYLSWKWININFFENKIKYCVLVLLFSIFTVIAWFLKQPYVGIVLFPVFIASFISIINDFKLKNIILRILTVFICIIFMIGGIKVWNNILKINNVVINESRNPTATFGDYLLNLCISEIDRNTYIYNENNEAIFELKKGGYNFNLDLSEKQINELSEKSKKEINNNKEKYKTFTIISKDDEYDIIFNKKYSVSIGNAIIYDLKYTYRHPFNVIKRQIKNYLTICNMYKIEFEGSNGLIPCYTEDKLKLYEANENDAISYKIYRYKEENNFYLTPRRYFYAEPYIEKNTPILCINFIMQKSFKIMTIIIKLSFLALPIIILIDIILLFINRKKYNKDFKTIENLMIILYLYSFMHIIAHSLIGSIIDRYTTPAIITTFIGIYLNIYLIIYRKKYIKESRNVIIEGQDNELVKDKKYVYEKD